MLYHDLRQLHHSQLSIIIWSRTFQSGIFDALPKLHVLSITRDICGGPHCRYVSTLSVRLQLGVSEPILSIAACLPSAAVHHGLQI